MRSKVSLFLVAASVFATQAFAADTIKEMFTQGTIDGSLRYYLYDLKTKDAKDAGDSVFAAILGYKTAPLKGISLAGTFASANDVATSNTWDNYVMLQSSGENRHKSFTKLLEYYAQGEWFDTTIRYGAQQIYTPLMNMDYCRILPKTYSGLTLVNRSIKDLELHAYYIDGFSGWTDSGFYDIVKSVDSSAKDKPLLVGGARYNTQLGPVNLGAEGWYYHMNDVVDTGYLRTRFGKDIGDYHLYFMPSVMVQKSNGENLGGKFDTYEYGFETGVEAYGVKVQGFYAKTGPDAQFTPWGFGKIVMQQFLVSGWHGKQDAYGALVGYDLGRVGVPGLSTYIWYNRYEAPGSRSSEIDYNVQYELKKTFNSALDGLKFEVGYAMVDNAYSADQNELRVRMTYPFSMGGGGKN
ncbi:OprD family outer membrane porin [Oryzomonas rubra]|uniref:Outer membrane porin, OprD family n=1 Tax=Oryzomonas rubra TaxID=2509454 RepID=A0A5A9XP24_9BACT|nr:OprD family outer membrane porin [Oryzomonas rubra]KAA0894295.1 outer membrane porin, OprD family [Oryzomonas rubra]